MVLPPDEEYILVQPHDLKHLHVEVSGKYKGILNARAFVNLVEKFGLGQVTLLGECQHLHLRMTVTPGAIPLLSAIPFVSSLDPYIAPFSYSTEFLATHEFLKKFAIPYNSSSRNPTDNPRLLDAFPCVQFAVEQEKVVPFPKHYLGLSLQERTIVEDERSLEEEFARLTKLWMLWESRCKDDRPGREFVSKYFACIRQILVCAHHILSCQRLFLADPRVQKAGLPISLIGLVADTEENSLNAASSQLQKEWLAASVPTGSDFIKVSSLLRKEVAFLRLAEMLDIPFNASVPYSNRVIRYVLENKCFIEADSSI